MTPGPAGVESANAEIADVDAVDVVVDGANGAEVAGIDVAGGVAVDSGELDAPEMAAAAFVVAPGARRGVAAPSEAVGNAGVAR